MTVSNASISVYTNRIIPLEFRISQVHFLKCRPLLHSVVIFSVLKSQNVLMCFYCVLQTLKRYPKLLGKSKENMLNKSPLGTILKQTLLKVIYWKQMYMSINWGWKKHWESEDIGQCHTIHISKASHVPALYQTDCDISFCFKSSGH